VSLKREKEREQSNQLILEIAIFINDSFLCFRFAPLYIKWKSGGEDHGLRRLLSICSLCLWFGALRCRPIRCVMRVSWSDDGVMTLSDALDI